MARGRLRRRGSTSSIDTTDLPEPKWCQEASVVKPAPDEEDPNDHILFEVKDVTVYPRGKPASSDSDDQNDIELPNILEVRVKGPFAARGLLLLEDDQQKKRVLIRSRNPIPIELRTVHSFSIGETEDQRPCIWMLGRCGAWYEVVPSAAYKPTYNLMAEAVFLYYRIVDYYSSPRSRIEPLAKRDDVSWLFLQYASAVGDGSTYEDVAERCEKHALFLFYQFESEREYVVQPSGQGISWNATEFYRWLKKRRNDALTAVQRALKAPLAITRETPIHAPELVANAAPSETTQNLGRKGQNRHESPSSSTDSGDDISGSSDSSVPNAVPHRQRSTGHTQVDKRTSTVDAIPQGTKEPVVTPKRPLAEEDRLAVSALAEAVNVAWSHTKVKPVKVSSVFTQIYIKYRFPDGRHKGGGHYKQAVEEVFHYYAQALMLDPAFKPFRDSELHTWLLNKAHTPFFYKCLSADQFPFLVTPRKTVNRVGKPAPTPEADLSSHPTTSGKRPPGRPRKSNLSLGTGRKRPHAEVAGASDDEGGLKRSNYFSDGDEAMDDATNTDIGDEAAHDNEQAAVSDGEPVDFVIRSEPLPSLITKRSDGAWVCDRNGCDYVVRGETEDVAQARIRKHIAEHAPLRCDTKECDFSVLGDDEDVAQLRMEQHKASLHGPWKCERDGCDFFARQENGAEEQRRVQEHIASHEQQEQKLTLAKSESRPHLPIEYGTLFTYLSHILRSHLPIPSSVTVQPTLPATQSSPPHDQAAVEPLDVEKLELEPNSRTDFRSMLAQFRRAPRPVSDKIADQDVLQSLARED